MTFLIYGVNWDFKKFIYGKNVKKCKTFIEFIKLLCYH